MLIFFSNNFDGLDPTILFGESLLFKKLNLFSNSIISFFNISNLASDIIGLLFS